MLFNLKKEKILNHAPTCKKLKDIVPVEMSQTQNSKYYLISVLWGTPRSQIHRDGK